jgi:hypothetical protein
MMRPLSPALTRSRRILARAREGAALMMALAARRELGGGVRQHPGSTTTLRARVNPLAPNPRVRAREGRGAGGASYGVVCDSTPVQTTALRAALGFLSPIPRACEGRAAPAPSVSRATHKQNHPLAPPGRRLAAVPSSF